MPDNVLQHLTENADIAQRFIQHHIVRGKHW